VSLFARGLAAADIEEGALKRIWREEIQPALDEIDELTEENRYLRQLSDRAADPKVMLPAAATFTLAIGGLAGVAQVVAAAAGLATIPLEALRAKHHEEQNLRRKRFYFLWNLQRRP
jgi:hypothetical protein